MIKTLFFATVGDDLSLNFLNVAKLKTHLLKLKGLTVEVTVERRRKVRSNEQLNYYWGVVLQSIADECGYREREEIQGLHEELKKKFLPLKGKLQIATSTGSLNTVEFNDYIEKVRAWASEYLSLYIPDPSEISQ